MPPTASIVVPCYNEEGNIGSLLGALLAQTYVCSQLEVVIADGLSTDNTLDVVREFASKHPELALRVVENPKRTIPAGLNTAIKEARGEFIVRLDAHSVPRPDYVQRCISALERGDGSSVGGMWIIQPGTSTAVARGIAAAAAHPLGAGDAAYRLGGKPGAVDTVPFGAFRRDLADELGGFDETLLTNEDYEFNARIRRSGRRIWFDPEIRSTYIARSTYRQLAKQYWRYGFWKFRMLSRYPETARARQLLPPLFLLSVLALGLALTLWRPAAYVLGWEVALYMLTLLAAGVQIAARARAWLLLGTAPLALATMHMSWGAGFLWGLVKGGAPSRG